MRLLSFIRAEFPKSKTPARTFAAMVSYFALCLLHAARAGALLNVY